MNEQEKAVKYDLLMREYMNLEKKMVSIPQLSLDEQMKQVDATHKILYTAENQVLVNEYKNRMSQIQREAQTSQLI
jgi:hypothetical protein